MKRLALCVAAFGIATGGCGSDATPPGANPPDGVTPVAPFGIAAEPGPSEESITITWSPVANAQTYALYFRTTPGVTPSNGQRIAGAPIGFIHSQLITGQTYYYIVAAINGDFEGPPSAEISAMPQLGIGMNVESPRAGDIVDVNVPLVVAVHSTQAIQTIGPVIAAVGGVSTTLTFDPSIARWTGTLYLGAFDSPSARQIHVTASDLLHSTAASVIVRLDRPPVLTVTSPADGAAAAPSVRVAATCTDDSHSGCASLKAYVEGFPTTPLASGAANIDATVSLSSFAPGPVRIVFDATDSAGQLVRVVRTVQRQ